MKLEDFGWDAQFAAAFAPYGAEGHLAGRVAVSYGSSCTCWTNEGEIKASVAGRLRLGDSDEPDGPMGLPTVGDWVVIRRAATAGSNSLVHAILPRRTAFVRKVAGGRFREQVVAANIDYVLIMTSLNREFSVRRLERYLTLTRESGAQPIVVLSKIDLAPELVAEHEEQLLATAAGVPIHSVSTLTGEGVELIRNYATGSQTIAILGSSGVGKSTLINKLAGNEHFFTQEIRNDDRGRHTTTHRELVLLPGGGILVDTPGMRELQLWESAEGLVQAFDDIEQLAAQCRFGNCHHVTEPGCAILQAVADGTLDEGRFDSYRRLQEEVHAAEQKKTEQSRRQNKRGEGPDSRPTRPTKKR